MTKPIFWCAGAAAILLSLTGPSFAATINFDDISTSFTLVASDRYMADGVLLGTDGVGVFAFAAASYTNTPLTYVYGSSSSGGATADKQVIVDFVLPGTTTAAVTDDLFFYVADGDVGTGETWSAAVYDLNGTLLDSFSSATNDEIRVTFSDAGIHRLVFTPSSDDEGLDSLNFRDTHAGAVPEPGTMILLATGLLGVAGSSRRRRG